MRRAPGANTDRRTDRGRPGPRTPTLRAVPGLASLPVVLAGARDFPRVAPGGFCALCRSLRAGDKGSVAALPASRPCARSSLPARRARPLRRCRWGGGLGFPPVPVRRSRRRLPPLPAAVGWVAPFGCFGFLGCVVVVLSRCSGFVPVVRVVLRSARCWVAPWGGSALGLSFRRSRRSLSGFVAVARFSSFVAASRFALSWGRRLPARPGFCAVRSVAGGFAVSVPVCPCVPPCRSGLRALVAARAA